jgi:ketosteroid isomerase-like protein
MVDPKLDELYAKHAITEVLYLYARGWDRFDAESLRACFHEDAHNVHGGSSRLAQDFITKGMQAMSDVKSMSHMITNPLIEIRGERAVSECSFFAHHRRMAADGSGEEDMFLKGRYLDVFEKRDGVWKIATRRRLHDFERVVPPADQTLANASANQLSDRKPNDPLYSLLHNLA